MKKVIDFETELKCDWQSLDLLEPGLARRLAIKAYYIKYHLYRKSRAWQLALKDTSAHCLLAHVNNK